MTKTYRQAKILNLIRTQSIRTQDELLTALAKLDIDVTQVTLSRDIRQLGLVKGAGGYREPGEVAASAGGPIGSLKRAVGEYVREVKTAQNLVIIRTVRGTAAPMADALDQEGWVEVAGTIAGEDTIFVAAVDARQARKVRDKLFALLR